MALQVRMDEAGRVAHAELAALRAKMTPEQDQGAQALIDWLQRHFREAGYKRLCRPLVHKPKQERPCGVGRVRVPPTPLIRF